MIPQFLRSESNQREAENPLVTGLRMVFTKRALRQAKRNEPSTLCLVCGRRLRRPEIDSPGIGGIHHAGGDHPGLPDIPGTLPADVESRLAGLWCIAMVWSESSGIRDRAGVRGHLAIRVRSGGVSVCRLHSPLHPL